MAEILSIFNFDLNTASPSAKSSSDIKSQNGLAVYFNDFSTLGYIENNGEATHLLVGYFVPTYGFSVKSISLKNPTEEVMCIDVGTYDSEDEYFYGTTSKLSGEKTTDAQMRFNSNYSVTPADVSKKLDGVLKLLETTSPTNLALANKILAETEKKYSDLFLTVPKIREQPAPSIFEEDDEFYF